MRLRLSFKMIMMALTFIILVNSSISISHQNELSTLYLEIDERDNVHIRIAYDLPKTSNFIQIFIVFPFMVQHLVSYSPSEALITTQCYESRYTIFSIIMPPNQTHLEIFGLTVGLVKLRGEDRILEVDFRYDSAPDMIQWLIKQDNTISTFIALKVVFPPSVMRIDQREIHDRPAPAKKYGSVRIYTYEMIMVSGGQLSIKYPSPLKTQRIIGLTLIAIAACLPTVYSIVRKKEEIRRHRKLITIICIFLWVIVIYIAYTFVDYLFIYIWILPGLAPLIIHAFSFMLFAYLIDPQDSIPEQYKPKTRNPLNKYI